MRPQLGYGPEADCSLRELRLDRSVGVERIRHAVDHTGFENGGGLRRFLGARIGGLRRPGRRLNRFIGMLVRPRRAPLGPDRIEGIRGRGARLAAEQKVEARGLPGRFCSFDAGARRGCGIVGRLAGSFLPLRGRRLPRGRKRERERLTLLRAGSFSIAPPKAKAQSLDRRARNLGRGLGRSSGRDALLDLRLHRAAHRRRGGSGRHGRLTKSRCRDAAGLGQLSRTGRPRARAGP
jgi:hypothetical protein